MNNILKNLFLKVYFARCIQHLSKLRIVYLDQDFATYAVGWHEMITEASSKTFLTADFLDHFPILNSLFFEAAKLHSDFQWEALDQLSTKITNALENTIVTLNVIPNFAKRQRFLVFSVAIFVMLAILVAKPIKKKYQYEKSIINLQTNGQKHPQKAPEAYPERTLQIYAERTLNDLRILRQAIDSFHNDNHSYPKTNSIWLGIKTPFGKPTKDWIPGLVPKYIYQLPSDPRQVRTDIQQYMYKSDGKDFKLIAHFPVGIDDDIKKHPEMIDFTRPSWSIGYWSENAKFW